MFSKIDYNRNLFNVSQNGEPDSFRCICGIGWTGEICQEAIDYCHSNPCMNNGTCHNLMTGHYCHCPIQYEVRYHLQMYISLCTYRVLIVS